MSNTVWVHGTSVQPAESNDVDAIERRGNGATYLGSPGVGRWFHFSIPSEAGRHLVSVSLDADMGVGHYVNKVHVYHGHYKLATFDNLNLTGRRVNKTFHIEEKTKVNRGVGISIQIASDPDSEKAGILFSVGATFG